MKKLLFLTCLLTAACQHSSMQNDAITGEIVVDFADNTSYSTIAELGKKLSIRFTPESSYSSVDKLYIGTYYGTDEEGVINTLRHNSNVEAADEDMLYTIPEHNLSNEGIRAENPSTLGEFPNDPLFKDQWHMRQIHLPTNWGDSVKDGAGNGNGVIVAVIDTGVSKLSDFDQTNIMPGYNFVSNNADARDDHGHGTHVAGTIAESTNNGIGAAGVAYRSIIMPIKVLSAHGGGSVAAISQGIRWATDHGAEVINMSLGGGGYSTVMANAVKYAHDKGVVVVCAAGNNGQGRVIYPAAYPGAIAVAATQEDERTTFYSNWGKEIVIAAPGGNTRDNQKGGVLQNTALYDDDDNAKEGYYYFMGTSMASPHIAGVVSLIISAGVVRKPDVVRQILVDTARAPAGMENNKPRDYSEHYGAGIVDANKAVAAANRVSGSASHSIKTLFLVLLLLGVAAILMFRKKK